MNLKSHLLIGLSLITLSTFAQKEKCATMDNLNEMIMKDPSLKQRMDQLEESTQALIQARKMAQQNFTTAKKNKVSANRPAGVTSVCGYNNVFYETIAGPTTLNQKVKSSDDNCVYGGEYVTVTGLVKGNTYRVSLCGANNFDTQLTIYPQGGGTALGHNDDWCGEQSELYFTPPADGAYDLLVNEFDCQSNTKCANLEVELWYIARPVIRIPVIVHVIHFGEQIGTGRNLSVAQIQSQIDVLNRDFRRNNADINSVPAPFRGLSSDPLIEFCLATKDPNGNASTGIERYKSVNSTVARSAMENSIKAQTIWDRDRYLNLWTVDFASPDQNLLGYAQFPGGTASTDGVVIRYNAFGNTGNVMAPYNLGRTTTHEVGHWLNLRHIWGDDTDCSGSDMVNDTPDQEVSSSGSPTFPQGDACTSTYPGIMFYNYMDYSDDATTSMFTYGQFVRMDATLYGPRVSLQSANICAAPVGLRENILNKAFNISPNPSTGLFTVQNQLVLSEDPFQITITDVLGKVVYQSVQQLLGEQHIDLNEQPNGVYFATITQGTQSVTKKLVLSRP